MAYAGKWLELEILLSRVLILTCFLSWILGFKSYIFVYECVWIYRETLAVGQKGKVKEDNRIHVT